jgi:hypothetical protein
MTANSENAFEMLRRRQSEQSALSEDLEESFSGCDERTGVCFDKILPADIVVTISKLFIIF